MDQPVSVRNLVRRLTNHIVWQYTDPDFVLDS